MPAAEDPAAPACALCGRPMPPGSANLHHLVPRSHGGRETVALHRLCHDKIHATLSEQELARSYGDLESLRAHPEIARFLAWVRRRPPGFGGRNRWSRQRRA